MQLLQCLQAGLLAELLTIEIEFRFSRGELVSADDYLSRFPDHAELIENAFDFAGNKGLHFAVFAVRLDLAKVACSRLDLSLYWLC